LLNPDNSNFTLLQPNKFEFLTSGGCSVLAAQSPNTPTVSTLSTLHAAGWDGGHLTHLGYWEWPAGHNVETVAIDPSKAKVCQRIVFPVMGCLVLWSMVTPERSGLQRASDVTDLTVAEIVFTFM
jgi:hypothetical protein